MNAHKTQTTMSQTTSQNIHNNQSIQKNKKKKNKSKSKKSQKKQIELFEKHSELSKQAYDEAHEGTRQSLKIKLRNMKNQRTNTKEIYDFSGNIIQRESYKRAFIMQHLAKVKLAEAFGIEGTLPSIAEIMKEWNKEKSNEEKSNEDKSNEDNN